MDMLCGMDSNLSQTLVDHGLAPESETTQNPQLNFFEKAFPCLFPFGEGGLERDQEVNVSFEDHIK